MNQGIKDEAPSLASSNDATDWKCGPARRKTTRSRLAESWSLEKFAVETITRMRKRVTDGLKTTFVTHYGAEISLREMLHPEMVKRYTKTGTGEKFLVKMDR